MSSFRKIEVNGLPATAPAIEKNNDCLTQGENTAILRETLRNIKEAGFGDTPMRVSVIVIELNPE